MTPQRSSVRRTGLYAAMALSLSLFAGIMLGSVTGGFSACCYDGSANYDSFKFQFGILDAHNGLLGTSHCNAGTALAPQFGPGATKVNATGDVVHAFWFLTSLYHGQNTCGFTGTAYQWGQAQGQMFIGAIALLSGYTGPIENFFGDVEHVGAATSCATDLARWTCNSSTSNRQVLKGFADYINSLAPGQQGFYSSRSQWTSITGDATASNVGAGVFWLASYGASQSTLNTEVGQMQGLGHAIASWQYTNDTLCNPSYATAQNRAETAFSQGYYVWRFDVWDNDVNITVC